MKYFILSVMLFLLSSTGNSVTAQAGTDSTKKGSYAGKSGYGVKLVKVHKKDTTKHEKRLSFGTNEGYGIPIGNFKKSDGSIYPISHWAHAGDTTKLGGYGLYGFHYEYFAAYRVLPHISVMISVGGNDIGYNINSVNSQFIQYFPPNTDVVTSGDNYYVIQYLGGIKYNVPLGHYFHLEFNGLAGITSTNYPSLSYIGFPESMIYQFPQGSGFGYNVSAGLKYVMADGYIGVHLNVSYAGSMVSFSGYSVSFFTPPLPNAPASTAIYLRTANFDYPKNLDVRLLQITFGVTGEL